MSNENFLNRDFLKLHNRIVIKVGTSTLTYPNGRLNLKRIQRLSWVLSDIRNAGREIILVTSAAIGVGMERLGLSERPRDTKGKQATSAVGQAVLMQIYQSFFLEYNQKVAQILLTKDVVDIKERKNNAQNTFYALFDMGVIPIVNENDTVSTYEIEFSDNDTLSAYVAGIVQADLLIILSDIEGLFSENPNINPNASIISYVDEITDDIVKMANGCGSPLSTGGMATKISAAQLALGYGIDTVIACGSEPLIIYDILDGKNVGTIFSQRKGRV